MSKVSWPGAREGLGGGMVAVLKKCSQGGRW